MGDILLCVRAKTPVIDVVPILPILIKPIKFVTSGFHDVGGVCECEKESECQDNRAF